MAENLWPAADRALWHESLASSDLFETGGVASRWRFKTIQRAKYAYARWLQHVNDKFPEVMSLPAAARVTPERVKSYIVELAKTTSAVSVAASLGHLVLALRAIAHERDWRWITQLQCRQLARATCRDKRPSMVPADQLYGLGLRLMSDAEHNEEVRDDLAYRDGLIIALLASRPLRRKNLAAIRIGKHAIDSGEQIRISFEAHEMKGGRPFECWLPGSLVRCYRRYVDEVRPRFFGASSHDYLWCSRKGNALTPDGIYQVIVKRTAEAFGKPVHPHLFRDIAATAIATDRPDQVHLARDLLGHASPETTERHYLHAQSVKAGATYGDLVRQLRLRG
jgi:integrase